MQFYIAKELVRGLKSPKNVWCAKFPGGAGKFPGGAAPPGYSLAISQSHSHTATNWWLSARLQYLQCISNGNIAVLHEAIKYCCVLMAHIVLRIATCTNFVIKNKINLIMFSCMSTCVTHVLIPLIPREHYFNTPAGLVWTFVMVSGRVQNNKFLEWYPYVMH